MRRIVEVITCDSCRRDIGGDESAWSHLSHKLCGECKPTEDRPCALCGGFATPDERARLRIDYAQRVIAFGKALAEYAESVAHVQDQKALDELMLNFSDVLDPLVIRPEGGLQGLSGVMSEEHGFQSDWYRLVSHSPSVPIVLARLAFEAPDD